MRSYAFVLIGCAALLSGFGVLFAYPALPIGALLSLALAGTAVIAYLSPPAAIAARVHQRGWRQLCGLGAVTALGLAGAVALLGPVMLGGLFVLGLWWLPVLVGGPGATLAASWFADRRGVRNPRGRTDAAPRFL